MRRLLPDHRLYLAAWGDAPNPLRFLHLFRETWQEIGLSHRRDLLSAWRGSIIYSGAKLRHRPEGSPPPFPAVSITDIPFTDEPKAQKPGRYLHATRQMKFFSPTLYCLPDVYARCIIGHELAHLQLLADPENADRYSEEHRLCTENPANYNIEFQGVELDADEHAQHAYDLPVDECEAWRHEHQDELDRIIRDRFDVVFE